MIVVCFPVFSIGVNDSVSVSANVNGIDRLNYCVCSGVIVVILIFVGSGICGVIVRVICVVCMDYTAVDVFMC